MRCEKQNHPTSVTFPLKAKRTTLESPALITLSTLNMKAPSEEYLIELQNEREKLTPFTQVLVNCSRLLDEEIERVEHKLKSTSNVSDEIEVEEGLIHSPVSISDESDHDRHQHHWQRDERTLEDTEVNEQQEEDSGDRNKVESSSAHESSSTDTPSITKAEEAKSLETPQKHRKISATELLLNPSTRPGDYLKTETLQVPVDKYPKYNFIGKILGPRGKYLKRIEKETDCRILIRGKGSMRNAPKERALAQKPGFAHLDKPLHLLIEACGNSEKEVDEKLDMCIPILEELLIPVSDEQDAIKQQQLKELRSSGIFRHRGSGKYPPYLRPPLHPPGAPPHYHPRHSYRHPPPPIPFGGPVPHGMEHAPEDGGRRHSFKARPSSSSSRRSQGRTRPY